MSSFVYWILFLAGVLALGQAAPASLNPHWQQGENSPHHFPFRSHNHQVLRQNLPPEVRRANRNLVDALKLFDKDSSGVKAGDILRYLAKNIEGVDDTGHYVSGIFKGLAVLADKYYDQQDGGQN